MPWFDHFLNTSQTHPFTSNPQGQLYGQVISTVTQGDSDRAVTLKGLPTSGLLLCRQGYLEFFNLIFEFVFYKWSPRENGACVRGMKGERFLVAWLLPWTTNPITLQPWQSAGCRNEEHQGLEGWRGGGCTIAYIHSTTAFLTRDLTGVNLSLTPSPGTKCVLMLKCKPTGDWPSTMRCSGGAMEGRLTPLL